MSKLILVKPKIKQTKCVVRESSRTVMLSNNKTRAIFTSSGHVAVTDGLLPLIHSAYERDSLGQGLLITAQTEWGDFSPFPLAHVPRGFRGEYFFETTEMCVRYLAHFSGKGICFSLTVCFFLAPRSSLFSTDCEISGDVKHAVFRFSFLPALKKNETEDFWCFADCVDEKSRFFLRERSAKNGKAEKLWLGVALTKDIGGVPLLFSVAREETRAVVISEEMACASFSLATARDPDDLLALLQRGRLGFASYYGWEALLSLQRTASGIGTQDFLTEEMLLTRMILGKKCVGEEKRKRAAQNIVLRELGLSTGSAIVFVRMCRADGEVMKRFDELIALFRYMCIRGVSFTLLLFCGGEKTYQEASAALTKNGGAGLAFYAGGIFLFDEWAVEKKLFCAAREYASVCLDLCDDGLKW